MFKWIGQKAEYDRKLDALRQMDLTALFQKTMAEMDNRADELTPRGETGKLFQTRGFKVTRQDGTYFYTQQYAPHVEYGHATRGGGFVPGQFYLKRNYTKQVNVFKKDVLRVLKEMK